jgi:alkylhydroperoxidase/carboxymuconolactone decarboxylase family protein YurZ
MTAEESSMESVGPWAEALGQLREWDPDWTAACVRMSTNPWTSGVLDIKFIELISVGLNACCTSLDAEATRRHIRAALTAGATREQIVFVLKCATVVSLHSCSVAAPILLEEAHAARLEPASPRDMPTPAVDAMRAAGQWNDAWQPFLELDPGWTDEAMAIGIGIYGSAVFTPKEIELLSIALDASYTHMYVPGIRRHIRAALQAGVTVTEIMEVLKICVAHGVQSCNLGVPILAEELRSAEVDSPRSCRGSGEA